MRGLGARIRWMALTLVLVCVGALSFQAPPVTRDHGGDDGLVRAGVATASALPAPSWLLGIEVGDDLAGPRTRRTPGTRPTALAPLDGQVVTGPSDPGEPQRRAAGSLLGLFFGPPANAPPAS